MGGLKIVEPVEIKIPKVSEPIKLDIAIHLPEKPFLTRVPEGSGVTVDSTPTLDPKMTITTKIGSNLGARLHMDLDRVMTKDGSGKTYLAHQMLQTTPSLKMMAAFAATFGVLGLVMNPGMVSWMVEHVGSILGFMGLPFMGMVMGGGSGKPSQPIPESLVEDFAKISDQALDKAYGYGLSKPETFGWEANKGSARRALELLTAGVTDVEQISAAIHEGWGEVAKSYEDPIYQTKPEKKQNRLKLADTKYEDLAESEKEKDRVVARSLLEAYQGKLAAAKVFLGDDGHGYQVRGFNEFSERPTVYDGQNVIGRRGKPRYLGDGRVEVSFEVFDTEVSWKRDKGAREVKIEMSRAEFEAKGLSNRMFRYYILTPDTPTGKSPITLDIIGDERAFSYVLKDQEGRMFMSIDTKDQFTAEQIHLEMLENYQETGSLAMAVDWLMRSPWDSSLFDVRLPTGGDAAPMGIFRSESDFVGLGLGYQTKNEDAPGLAPLEQSPWDPSSDTVALPTAGDAVFSFSPAPFQPSPDDFIVTGSDGFYWPPETNPDLHATPPPPPPEITARSEGGRDYRIVTHQLADRYNPHTILVWVKDPSDIVLQPDGKISVTFQETLTEKQISFTLKPSEAATLGIRPGERPETYFTLWN